MSTPAHLSRVARALRGLSILAVLLACLGCGGRSAQPQAGPLANDCVWFLQVKDPELAQTLRGEIMDGRSFVIAGRRVSRDHPQAASQDLGCPPLTGLPYGVVQAAGGLALGQVSDPLDIGGATVWVMRGSDRHRLLGQALFARQRHQAAIQEALADLALNPASIGSWLVLGKSRLALGDAAGAIKAFDQGLLVDPRDPDLLQAREMATARPAAPEPVPEAPAHEAAPGPETRPTAEPVAAAAKTEPQTAPPAVDKPPAPPAGATVADRERLAEPPPALAQPAGPEAGPSPPAEISPAQADPLRDILARARQEEESGDRQAATLSYHRAARLDPRSEEAAAGLKRNFLALDTASLERMQGMADQSPAPAAQPAKTAPAAPTAPAATSVKSAPPRADTGQTGGVFIQVASYRDREGAEREQRSWTARKLKTLISPWKAADGVTWQRVLVGPFPNTDQAREAARRLKKDQGLDFYLLVNVPSR
ncbi:MAG: SPOR domain-containing protein [Thermodesulfobacteriota bacterium]